MKDYIRRFTERIGTKKRNNLPAFYKSRDIEFSLSIIMDGILNIEGVEWCIEDNGDTHHTWDYYYMEKGENSRLVVRRGQSFLLLLKTDRKYDIETDVIVIVTTVQDAQQPSISHGTQVIIPLEFQGNNALAGLWKGEMLDSSDNNMLIRITSSSGCIVGPWEIEFDTKLIGFHQKLNFKADRPFFIIFNPWFPDDPVFVEEEADRKEYVLEESGLLFRGTAKHLQAAVWNYSQFEDPVLDVSIWSLWNISKLPPFRRSDPIAVSRAISAAVNHADDGGIMVALWSDAYEGGFAPTKWTGSLEILKRYWESKEPVKFGQCFNFAGVITTICRSLGIPCRPVTNYESAHDSHGSLTVDVIVDDNGYPVAEKIFDTVWNYHVWNEVWMKRPDLAPGDYDGWQVIDGTPQEASEGLFQCGPTSVKAVKRGEIRKHYDTCFVFAEVNADRVFWRDTERGLKFLHKQTSDIGLNVSTKCVGKFGRSDVTDRYKFKENSAEEREVVLRALRQSESHFTRIYLNQAIEDIQFELISLDDVIIGETIKANLVVTNRSEIKRHSITAILRIDSVLYTGKMLGIVKKEKFEAEIEPKSRTTLTLELPFREYAGHVSEQGSFKYACIANVAETEFEYFSQDDFSISKPIIDIKVPEEVVVGEEFPVTVSLVNPLPINLVSPRFIVQGAGMGRAQKSKLTRIPPGGEGTATVRLTPKHKGVKTIAVKFWARDLQDVNGYTSVKVIN